MNKNLLLSLVFYCCLHTTSLKSQAMMAPVNHWIRRQSWLERWLCSEGLNYQAVARDEDGTILSIRA